MFKVKLGWLHNLCYPGTAWLKYEAARTAELEGATSTWPHSLLPIKLTNYKAVIISQSFGSLVKSPFVFVCQTNY